MANTPGTLAQWEVESIALINIIAMLMCVPLMGIYAHQTVDGVYDVEDFIFRDPRGQELLEVLVKFVVFVLVWTPMSVLLKAAASRRNSGLLKTWNIFQVILIFIVALHLLAQPPTSLIMVLAYVVSFVYFLISLWICENLIEEIKQENSVFTQMINTEEPHISTILAFNDSNNNTSSDTNNSSNADNHFNEQIYGYDPNQLLSLEMKKVVKTPA